MNVSQPDNTPTSAVAIRHAAQIIGVHPNSLRRAEREGRIPKARREPISGQRYYTVADVRRLVAHFGVHAPILFFGRYDHDDYERANSENRHDNSQTLGVEDGG